jgi:hypothetical protein
MQLPLCETHRRAVTLHHPRLRILALFLGLLASGFTFLAAWAFIGAVRAEINPFEKFGSYWIHTGIAFGCAMLALLIRARLHDGFLYLESVTDEALVLGGVTADVAERIGAMASSSARRQPG